MKSITNKTVELSLSVSSVELPTCVPQILGAVGEGADSANDGQALQVLKAEMEKLTGLYGQRIDWQQVEVLALRVLEQQREISAAIWLGCAWFKCRGLPGLVDASHLLWQLFDRYWEEMSPPAARLRARRNQLLWLLDFMDAELKGEFEALDQPLWDQLQNHWQAIAAFWQMHDDQRVDFTRVLQVCRALPCAGVQGVLEVCESVPQVMPQVPDSPSAAVSLTVPEALSALVNQCIEQSLLSPLLYRLNRLQSWGAIRQCPEAIQEASVIPAPGSALREDFARVQEDGVAQSVLHFCETHLPTQPLWLDLSRASHDALVRLEAFEAAAAVVFEINELVQRIPLLAGLSFADGQPFADPQTRTWLAAVQPKLPELPVQESAAPDETFVDELTQRIKAAEHLAAVGQIGEALAELQRQVAASHAGRERFYLRLAQCELMQRFGAQMAAHALFEALLGEVHQLHLDAWEPALVQRLIALAANQGDGLSSQWFAHLAALDGHAAWMLTAQGNH